MKLLQNLFDQNAAWANHMLAINPQFFENLSKQQKPKHFWIGCSDSRVPANEIIGLPPGEVFVHRNVANLVVYSDLNCLSTIQFAVDILQVKHIMVVGHYGCGGVRAALENKRVGLADNWLCHLRNVAEKYYEPVHAKEDPNWQCDRLCELNVLEQARHVCQTTVLRDAWARGAEISVHGWIYGLNNGLIHDLDLCVTNAEEGESVFSTAIDKVIDATKA
ncbi:MAG: carbonate dehydratase [Verrucomicrobium sp.]|nr:carbonate dehydratase [Verrucomicrobium sp.]